MVVVQFIRTTWSKRSRGEPPASVRAAVPEAAPLQDVPIIGPCVVQVLVADEESDFHLTGVTETLPGLPITVIGVRVEREGDGLRVTRLAPPTGGWAPHGRRVHAFTLDPGCIGRVVWSDRRSGTHGAHYEKVVTNVAEVDALTADLFIARAPDTVLDDRGPRS